MEGGDVDVFGDDVCWVPVSMVYLLLELMRY